MNTLNELLEDQIKDLYNAEQQLSKALPKLLKKATSPELKQAIKDHLAETLTQIDRLQQVADHLEIKPKGKVCAAMQGLIAEAQEVLEEDGDDHVLDIGLVAAAQRV